MAFDLIQSISCAINFTFAIYKDKMKMKWNDVRFKILNASGGSETIVVYGWKLISF